MEVDIAHLQIPAHRHFLSPAVHFVLSYAEQFGIEKEKYQQLKSVSETALTLLMESNVNGRSEDPISIHVTEDGGTCVLTLENRGLPIFSKGNGSCAPEFSEISNKTDNFSLENHGSRGQTLILKMGLGQGAIENALKPVEFTRSQIEVAPDQIVFRSLEPGEEEALSQLFYFVYGYHYINEMVYYPDKIKALIQEDKLIPLVAVSPDGMLLGHVGLFRWNDSPSVYEPCLGVVHPDIKSQGLFGKLFQYTMSKVYETPMHYCFFDCVTNHDFSQRWTSRYKASDLALFIGCQNSETQAKLKRLGIGEDPKDMDRYSLLYSIIPRVDHPFGKEITLPENLGELLGFLLKPLNLVWTPAPRFWPLQAEGQYKTSYQPVQNAVLFDLHDPGRNALKEILHDWNRLLKDRYQYAAVEVPIQSPGLGQLRDILADHGFFISGFMPYHFSDKLGVRFQSIGPTKVAFDQIKVYSPTAKKLLPLIQSDYERNGLI